MTEVDLSRIWHLKEDLLAGEIADPDDTEWLIWIIDSLLKERDDYRQIAMEYDRLIQELRAKC